jgi:hypothetical protein
VALVVGLLVWRPWAVSLETEDFIVLPFQADVPDDWQTYPVTGDQTYSVLGSRDWTGLATEDSDAVAESEKAFTDDPESLIHLYVDGSESIYTDNPQDFADQVTSLFGEGRLVGRGERQVDGRAALTAGGVVPFDDNGGQLRIYAVTLQDDPRLFMLFICPASLYEEWQPTFDDIVDSVRFTG